MKGENIMQKRLLNCTASDMKTMTAKQILDAISGSEGRILAAESIGVTMPLLEDVTNAEVVSSMGADIILLNMFDVLHPVIQGLPEVKEEDTIKELKRLTGRIIGINLEPVKKSEVQEQDELWKMTPGRYATAENAAHAASMGVDMILLTGNPGNGVSNEAIVESLKAIRKETGNKLILAAGKMHASGVLSESAEKIITKADILEFKEAGADIILLPAPGTVPGIAMEYVKELVTYAHSLGELTITAIGTSQEGADKDTIRQIALMCKMTGTDIHHIGDSGYVGMALPENIMTYSIAIRGVRHTYRRIARSINR